MDLTRLTRQSHRRPRPGLRLLGRFDLAGARAHEACGSARRRLALWLARETRGPVIWIRPSWHPDRLHMATVRRDIDPARLLLVEVERAEDLLWSTEEALRAGAVALVVSELPEPPPLTPVRRLHLAAEAGAERGEICPLPLLLTPGDGGAAGVESRWRLTPAHGRNLQAGTMEAPHDTEMGEQMGWHLSRLRARTAPPQEWHLIQHPGQAPRPVETTSTMDSAPALAPDPAPA